MRSAQAYPATSSNITVHSGKTKPSQNSNGAEARAPCNRGRERSSGSIDDRRSVSRVGGGIRHCRVGGGGISGSVAVVRLVLAATHHGEGRERDDETILFWHRGLSLSDIALGGAMLAKAKALGIGQQLFYAHFEPGGNH